MSRHSFFGINTDFMGANNEHSLCHKCAKLTKEGGCYIRRRLMRLGLIHGVLPIIWECKGFDIVEDKDQLKLKL